METVKHGVSLKLPSKLLPMNIHIHGHGAGNGLVVLQAADGDRWHRELRRSLSRYGPDKRDVESPPMFTATPSLSEI